MPHLLSNPQRQLPPIADVRDVCELSKMTSAEIDQRSVPELFEAAFSSHDQDFRWDAIAALHWRGSRDVFDRAAKLCRSSTAGERALGADILGQLGIPERAFREESFAAVLKLLSDSDINVLCSAILALQHIDAERAAAHVTPFSNHPNEDVRSAVAFALCGVEGEAALRTLLSLAKDEDGDVRNWATFGLGQQSEADTPEVREALAAGLRDREEDVRYEAIIGLARRRDTRMSGFLKTMLHNDPDDVFAREAAARLLGMEHSGETTTGDLLGALQRQQRFAQRGSP
jgi:HEAT repeat protein